jgi:hypothetical protein
MLPDRVSEEGKYLFFGIEFSLPCLWLLDAADLSRKAGPIQKICRLNE